MINPGSPSEKNPIVVSIAVVSYYDSKYYFETIDSILQQDYPYIDLILSDDASTDFNAELVKSYVNSHKGTNILSIQVFHQPNNLGTVAHAEFCRRHANGDLFYLIGAGDKIENSNIVSRVVHTVETSPNDISIFCGQTRVCDENMNQRYLWTSTNHINIIKSGDSHAIFSTLSYKTIIPTTSVFYKMSFFNAIGGYDTDYKLAEDAPTYLKAARLGVKIAWIDGAPLASHRAGGICHSKVDYKKPTYIKFTADRINIFKKEVFPYVAQIDKDDIVPMLNLWFSSKGNYLNSHSDGVISKLLLRLRLCTFFVILSCMLKRKDPNAGFGKRFAAFWRVIFQVQKMKCKKDSGQPKRSKRKRAGFSIFNRLFPPSAYTFNSRLLDLENRIASVHEESKAQQVRQLELLNTVLKRTEYSSSQLQNALRKQSTISADLNSLQKASLASFEGVTASLTNLIGLPQQLHFESSKLLAELRAAAADNAEHVSTLHEALLAELRAATADNAEHVSTLHEALLAELRAATADNAEHANSIRMALSDNHGQIMDEVAHLTQRSVDSITSSADALLTIQNTNTETLAKARQIMTEMWALKRYAYEILWSAVFHDTIIQSSWFANTTLSPGRWAAGYPALYAMYRILDERKPKSILEIGLGMSTRVISQYADANTESVEHYVVEDNEEWIKFFTSQNLLPKNTKLIKLDIIQTEFNGVENISVYNGFKEAFEGLKFDYITIDAPPGSKGYSRVDVINILPACLEQSFVITLDDYERSAEKNTGNLIEALFQENNIPFVKGSYRGTKDVAVWASPDNSFLCSL